MTSISLPNPSIRSRRVLGAILIAALAGGVVYYGKPLLAARMASESHASVAATVQSEAAPIAAIAGTVYGAPAAAANEVDVSRECRLEAGIVTACVFQ